MPEHVALHTIGQTPRPDLTPFMLAALGTPYVTITGALDGLSADSIPTPDAGDYPLETRLNDGTRVEIGSSFVEPLIQSHIDRLEIDVAMHLVLCAGPFPALHSKGLLVRPFEHAAEHFASQGLSSLLVIVPFAGQGQPALNIWKNAGFSVQVRSMDELAPPTRSTATQTAHTAREPMRSAPNRNPSGRAQQVSARLPASSRQRFVAKA